MEAGAQASAIQMLPRCWERQTRVALELGAVDAQNAKEHTDGRHHESRESRGSR